MVNKRISYSAVTSSKEIVNGIFDGNKREFEEFIRQKKLIVTSFKEIKKKLKKGKLTQDDFLALIEELYYLINSGMSIDKAIKLLITTSAKEAQIKILVHILEDIKGGTQLSLALKSSLEKEKFNVDALSIGFIATSEEVGNLSDGLLQLFEYLTFQKVIRGDIKQALAYPMFLMGMAVVVSFLIFFLIIPKFSTIFSPEEFERLPSLSYAILSLGNYLNDNGAMVFSIIIAIVLSFIIFIKRVGINWLSIFYHTPKLRDLVIDIQLSIVYGALGTMLKGGLELDRALRQLQKIKLLKEIKEAPELLLYVPGHGPSGKMNETIDPFLYYMETVLVGAKVALDEDMEAYEVKPVVVEKLQEYLKWDEFSGQLGKHLQKALGELEALDSE